MNAQSTRTACALAIVAALVAAAPAIDALLPQADAVQQTSAAPAGIDASALAGRGTAEDALARLEGLVQPSGELPSWFEREIGFLPGAYDARAAGPVVGYLVDMPCADALATLQAHMETRGWTCVSLGGVDGATFVKQAGACTWALATCTQVGDATSVVIRGNVS